MKIVQISTPEDVKLLLWKVKIVSCKWSLTHNLLYVYFVIFRRQNLTRMTQERPEMTGTGKTRVWRRRWRQTVEGIVTGEESATEKQSSIDWKKY